MTVKLKAKKRTMTKRSVGTADDGRNRDNIFLRGVSVPVRAPQDPVLKTKEKRIPFPCMLRKIQS